MKQAKRLTCKERRIRRESIPAVTDNELTANGFDLAWIYEYGGHEADADAYAPSGSIAYDVDTQEGSAAAHRADMMFFPYCEAGEY